MKPVSALFLVLGILVLAVLFFLLKPGASTAPSPAATTASLPAPVSPATHAPAGTYSYEMVVEHGAKRSGPETMRVFEGDEVNLKILSDRADELHLHGYDLRATIKAGVPAVLKLKADHTGRFTMELHHSNVELGALEVQPR